MKAVRILAFLIAAAAFVLMVWWVGLGQALTQVKQRGESDLALASDRLVKQLERYSELIVVLAGDPRLQDPLMSRDELSAILL